jgi:glycosyltransferase involved in cell wall biosynthesis
VRGPRSSIAAVPPRVVAIAPGDPFDVRTFSGISTGLLSALRDRGALEGAVDGRPRALQRLEQAASIDRDRRRWRQWYYAGASPLGPLVREGMSVVARRRAAPLVRSSGADALLQLTGWYRPRVPGVLRASFHDGNLAATLQRPDLLIDPASRRVRRAMAWERRLYDDTDVIFTMSAWLRDIFIGSFGQAPEKVVVAGAGTDLTLPPDDLTRDFSTPRFLFVGREWERKGGPELLRAWPAVRAARPTAELTIIGPAELPGPLPDGVAFVGHIDRGTAEGELAFTGAYRRATAFVLPSLFEPFGIVLLEAMAYGLPCVAGVGCAMPEIVEDGATGRIADTADPAALAAAMLGVCDADAARTMGAAGRRRLQERFTWDAVAGRILEAIAARIA